MKCEILKIPDFCEAASSICAAQHVSIENLLFFDIETTGLSPKTSHLYLLGAAYMQDGICYLKQWFVEDPAEEKEVITLFYHFMKGFDVLIHFNGSTFDLPYVQAKWDKYRLPYSFQKIKSVDLYKLLLPWKHVFGLPNLKQKTLEAFMGRNRLDPFDGGQLIAVYKDYLMGKSAKDAQCLLLHNKEDVEGLTALPHMLSYIECFNGNFTVEKWEHTQEHLDLLLRPGKPLPAPITLHYENYVCTIRKEQIILTEKSNDGWYHKFYENPKDYYYLPEDDTIIPKVMATGIDKSRRKNASPATCYTRFRVTDTFLSNKDNVAAYARSLLYFLAQKK
jgi:hypothetical protein